MAYNSSDPTIKIVERCNTSTKFEVQIGFGRVVASHYRASTSYQIHNIFSASTSEATKP